MCRISYALDELGVTRQDKGNRELAEQRGWHVVETYTDNSVSAYKGMGPETRRALDGLRTGRLAGLVAFHPDRIFGHPRDLEDLIDLIEETGAVIATQRAGSYDLSTASGRLVARQLGAASRFEREMKAERQREKHLELARAGKVGGGGNRPYGYSCYAGRHSVKTCRNGDGCDHTCDLPGCPHDGSLSVIEHEAEIIREAAARIIAGETLTSICADLNARGIPTSGARRWGNLTLKRSVAKPRVAGLRAFRTRDPRTRTDRKPQRLDDGSWSDVIGEAVWPAILDRETWDQVRDIVFDDGRYTGRRLSGKYLMTGGLAVCGMPGCGAGLVARPRADGRRCYVCASPSQEQFNGCGKIRILADHPDPDEPAFEAFVVEQVLQVFSGDGLTRAIRRAERSGGDRVGEELRSVEAKIQRLDDDHYVHEILTRAEWLRQRERLKARQTQLSAQLRPNTALGALRAFAAMKGTLRERWAAAEHGQRRGLLAAVIERVVVGPAVRGRNYFDPERVRIDWVA